MKLFRFFSSFFFSWMLDPILTHLILFIFTTMIMTNILTNRAMGNRYEEKKEVVIILFSDSRDMLF